MDGVADVLLLEAAVELKGRRRRMFLAKVCNTLCDGSARKTEERFGWGRETVSKGQAELQSKDPPSPSGEPERRGRPRSEDKNPQLKIDIQLIVEPHTHSDPELKASRKYTDAIFDNVHAAREKYRDDPETVGISVDTKTKVSLGEYSLGGKNTD